MSFFTMLYSMKWFVHFLPLLCLYPSSAFVFSFLSFLCFHPVLRFFPFLCRPVAGLAALVDVAGASLRHPKGHLYYVGAGLFGVVGFIDSSEMTATFGSSPHEVRGFVEGGWTACQNKSGELGQIG